MLRYTMDTDQRVLDFIIKRKDPPGKDRPGKLQMSIVAMAKDMNMSGSTVHRAIERLQAGGYILSKASPDKREPNIIEYLGERNLYSPRLARETREKLEEFISQFSKLEDEYIHATNLIRNNELAKRLAGYNIVSETELPDGNKVLVLSPSNRGGSA